MVELKVNLSVLEEWLQEYGEDQRCGWTMWKKKVRWHSMQVKLRQRMSAKVQEELRATEYKMNVCLYEPEQEVFFNEDVEERPIESLICQHEDMLMGKSDGAREPYIFKTDNLCVVAGDGKSSKFIDYLFPRLFISVNYLFPPPPPLSMEI
jgi:hypothetical protein